MGRAFRIPIIFFVMVLLHFSYGKKRQDFSLKGYVAGKLELSPVCLANKTSYIFLTYGMGISDSIVITIASTVCPNCKINIKTDENIFLFMTIEFPNKTKGKHSKKNACIGSSNALMVSYGNQTHPTTADVCDLMNKNTNSAYIFLISHANEVNITITCQLWFDAIKITVTAAKALKENHECIPKKEQICKVPEVEHKEKHFCFTIEVQCDGNINCIGGYDDHAQPCKDSQIITPMLICLIVIAVIIALTFIVVKIILRLSRSREKDISSDEGHNHSFIVKRVFTSLRRKEENTPELMVGQSS